MTHIEVLGVEVNNLKKVQDAQEKKIENLHEKMDELPDKIFKKIERSILLLATLAGTVSAVVALSFS